MKIVYNLTNEIVIMLHVMAFCIIVDICAVWFYDSCYKFMIFKPAEDVTIPSFLVFYTNLLGLLFTRETIKVNCILIIPALCSVFMKVE